MRCGRSARRWGCRGGACYGRQRRKESEELEPPVCRCGGGAGAIPVPRGDQDAGPGATAAGAAEQVNIGNKQVNVAGWESGGSSGSALADTLVADCRLPLLTGREEEYRNPGTYPSNAQRDIRQGRLKLPDAGERLRVLGGRGTVRSFLSPQPCRPSVPRNCRMLGNPLLC